MKKPKYGIVQYLVPSGSQREGTFTGTGAKEPRANREAERFDHMHARDAYRF